MTVPMLDTFDTTNTALPSGDRTVTTVAPQALMLLNDRFIHEQAESFARRIVADVGNDPVNQIAAAYQLALSRKPTQRESMIAMQYLQRQTSAYESLRTRLRFEPDVPSSIFNGYLKKLSAADLLFGPKAGWKYARGMWGGGYEGILQVDPAQGPCAIAEGTKFQNGSVQGKVHIANGCDLAGLMARAKLNGEELVSAYDLVLSPKTDAILLRRLEKNKVTILAAAGLPMDAGQWFDLKILVQGERIIGYVDSKQILLAHDPKPLPEGEAGVRAWGATTEFDQLSVSRTNHPEPVYDGKNWSPREKALASLAIALFNLNEFVYVD